MNNAQMNPHFGNQSSKKKKPQIKNNFLEAFKSIAQETVKTVAAEPGKIISKALGGGELKPNQAVEVGKIWTEKDTKLSQERRLSQQKEQEWQGLLVKEQQIVRMGLEQVRQELRKLVTSLGKLGKEVDKATFEAPVNPGIYHQNLFEILKQTLKNMRLKADQSASWVAMYNQRSSKRQGVFWANFKKHGTKYALSGERGAAFSGA
jgi:hypothetical protein